MITAAVIQARTSSTRLPGKVFAELAGKPLIHHIVERLRHSRRLDRIILATTVNPADDALEKWAAGNELGCYRGSEEDVLSRFRGAALQAGAGVIVRVTADDPFKDPVIMDRVIDGYHAERLDFAYNNHPPTYPEGLDVEVFSLPALQKADKESTDPFEREHVTPYFFRHIPMFKQKNFPFTKDFSHLRLTVDAEEDLRMARILYDRLYDPHRIFLTGDILKLLEAEPSLARINSAVPRSAMYRTKTKEGLRPI